MHFIAYKLIGLTFLFLLIIGCDEDCTENSQTLVLSGEIQYPGYKTGVIDLRVYESISMDCGSKDPVTAKTPGDQLTSRSFDAPGAFMLLANITWTGKEPMKPELLIVAHLYEDGIIDGPPCDAGWKVQLPATDHMDMRIILEPGSCPTVY